MTRSHGKSGNKWDTVKKLKEIKERIFKIKQEAYLYNLHTS